MLWFDGHLPGWQVVVLALAAAATSTHILLHKPRPRAAMGWLGLIWMVPVVGVVMYAMFGVNRDRRDGPEIPEPGVRQLVADDAGTALPGLDRLIGQVTGMPLRPGNRTTLYRDGDAAYPAMIEAIEQAEHSVALMVFLFDLSPAGERFVDALGDAVDRGVDVRVMVDGMGIYYDFPRNPIRRLRNRGVRATTFSWTPRPWRRPTWNLRNHRKLLAVDGRVGFTGGMNIRGNNDPNDPDEDEVRDVMVHLEGPIVADLVWVFASDWGWTTGETLEGEAWFPELEPVGEAVARLLPDGPDDDLGVAVWARSGALTCATERVHIATPYFLPPEGLLLALQTAAMRGIRVDLVLPENNDVPPLHQAALCDLEELVEAGVNVWLAPGPFDHSKVMVVDGCWSLVGSCNWDARSLRLNYELDLECYDPELAEDLVGVLDERIEGARRLTVEDFAQRSTLARLRDRAVWLWKPYL